MNEVTNGENCEFLREAAAHVARERDFHNQRFADDSEREMRVGRFYAAIKYGFDRYQQRVAEESRGRRLLEYGCGAGQLAFDLATTTREVIGIDISDVAIDRARARAREKTLKNVTFIVGNAEAMQLPDQRVDVVAGSGIIHHLAIPEAMREVRRVLRPGGIAIFAEPLGHNPLLNWYRRRTPDLRTPDEHPLMTNDLRSMRRMFASIHITYFGLIAPLLGLIARHPNPESAISKAIWWLDRRLCRLPVLSRYAWYCLVELRTQA